MSVSLRAGVGAGAAACGIAGYAYWRQRRHPVVVVGGGVMGLCTAERLARAGRKVILLDADHPIRGSWGVSRASHFRMEDETLLKMSMFSVRRWLELQQMYASASSGAAEDTLFYKKTGAMMAGPADAIENLVAKVRQNLGSAPEGEAEVLSPKEVVSRFPQVSLASDEKLVYMPAGYTILVSTCLQCLKWAAECSGVQYEEESVVRIDRAHKLVTTESGKEIGYTDLVVTAGPWTNKILESAGLSGVPMVVSNEQTVELVPKAGAPSHDWDSLPLFTWSEAGYKGRAADGGCRYFYTVPHVPISSSGSGGVKIGFHRQGSLLNTDDFHVTEAGKSMIDRLPHLRRELHSEQQYELDEFAWKQVQEFVKLKMPGLDAEKYAGFMRCLYQCTPDLNMIVGRHVEDQSIVFACGFSGSGFQFAPAIAETLTALVVGGKLEDMQRSMCSKFSPGRF